VPDNGRTRSVIEPVSGGQLRHVRPCPSPRCFSRGAKCVNDPPIILVVRVHATLRRVKKLERLDEARTPDGTVLALFRHDGDYLIRADGAELMSTRHHHSEDALAELGCRPLRERATVRVLIGGLGLGFTLKAALRILAPDATVVVAELLRAVIDWNERPDYALAGAALRDPRVELRHADVALVLREQPAAWDAIMLDVDNGPDPMTTSGNGALYGDAGVRMSAAALRPGGRLVYWSAQDDRAFERTLRRAGLAVSTSRVWSHGTSGVLHTLFVATKEP
jgi:Spermidine synthase